MTKEEIIKKYDQKRMGGAQNSASSKSALSKEEIIKKYDERQAAKTRERQMIEIANRTPEEVMKSTYQSYIPEEYKGTFENVDLRDSEKIEILKNTMGADVFNYNDIAEHMTEDELKLLKKIYEENGLDILSGDSKHNAYIKGLREEIDRRRIETAAYNARKNDDFLGKVGTSVKSVGNNLMSVATMEGVGNAINGLLGYEIDETPYYQTLTEVQRQAVSEDMSVFGKFLYNTGMSMADSAVMTAIGALIGGGAGAAATKVAEVITMIGMGSQAMSSTITDSKKRGMSDGQAVANGVVAGILEAVFEKIGLDALFDTKLFKNSVASYLFKNIGSNAAEEAGTEIAQIVSDGLIGWDKSNFAAKVREYEGKGYSESGAAAMAVLSSLGDTGLAALSGALMGLGFGGAGIAGNTIKTNAADVQRGRQITELAHANTDLYGAAKLAEDAEINKILDAVYKAQEGSRTKYRLTGKLARQTGGVYQQRQNGRFTPQEMDQQEIDIRKEEYVQTPFEREYGVYSEKVKTAAAVDLEEEAKALAAKNAGEDYGEKYEGETSDAYYKGLANYKNKEKAYQYPLWFEIARKMGQDSNGRSVDEMIKTLPFSDRRGVLSLDTDTIKAAFNDGKRIADAIAEEQKAADERRKRGEERIAERKRAVEAEKGKESTEGEKTASETTENTSNVTISDDVEHSELSPMQKKAIAKIKQVMKYIPGYEVTVQKGHEYDGKLNDENGYFDPVKRMIYLNIDAGKVTGKIKIRGQDVAVELYDVALESALTHEIGHAIRVDSPKLYAELRDFIRTRLYREGGFQNLVKQRQQQYADVLGREISYEYAEEEVICNSLGDILTSERVMDELAGTHRNLFARIWRLVKDFFSKILKRMRSMDGDFAYKTTEQRVVEKALLVERRRLEDLFVKALRDASATSKATIALGKTEAQKNVAESSENSTKSSKNAENMQKTATQPKKNNGSDKGTDASKTAETVGKYSLPDSIGVYSAEERQRIKAKKENIIARSYEDVLEFFEYSISDKSNAGRTMFIGKIANKTADKILKETGLNAFDKSIAINSHDLRHMMKEHGDVDSEEMRNQEAISTENFEYVIETIANPDEVTTVKDEKSGVISLIFKKEITGKTTAITIFSEKRKTLTLKTAWIIKKEQHISQPTNAEALIRTPEAGSSLNTVPSDSITENAEKVNPSEQKNVKESLTEKFSLRDTLAREQLSEMFYEMAATPVEREIVEKYKAEIVNIDAKIDERREILERLSEIEGKSGFSGERSRLEGRLKGVNAYITGRDRRLFELESAKPFKEMVERYDEEIRNYRKSSSASASSEDGRMVLVPRGKFNELTERKRKDYYTKEDAETIEWKIEGFDVLSPFNKKKLVDELQKAMNSVETEEDRENAIQTVSEHISKELIRTFYAEDVGDDKNAISEQNDIRKEVEKTVREAFDEGGNKAYSEFTRDADRAAWEVRKLKQGAFDKVKDANGESIMKWIRDLSGLEYSGSFSVQKMRNYAKKAEVSYKSDEVQNALRFDGEEVPFDPIAGYLKQLSEGKGKATEDDMQAIAEVLSYFAETADRYNEYQVKLKNKEKLSQVRKYYGNLRAVDHEAWKLRSLKLGKFQKAADVDGWHPVKTILELANMKYGRSFNVTRIREKMQYLAEWYGSEAAQEFIKYTEANRAGKYSEEIAASMRAIANGKGGVTEEYLQTLASVLSYFHKMAEGYNKVWAKDKVDEIVSMQKGLIACDREARSIREMKLGAFDNMAEIKSEKVMGIVRELAKFTYRGTFPVNKVREKVKRLYEWYHSPEAQELLNWSKTDPGEWSEFVENTLREISDGEGTMTGDELMAFSKVLAHFRRIAQSYNKVWRAGKWEKALPIAEKYIGKLLIADSLKGKDFFLSKAYRTYYNEFADPLSVVRRYDGYVEDGYFTDTFLTFRNAAMNLDVTYSDVMKEYHEFLDKKENKHYLRDIQTRYVEVYGEKIQMDQAMALYMMLRQDHALKGFVTHGVQYVGMDGNMKLAIPVENKIKRAVQDMLFAQQTEEDYEVGDSKANKTVKDAIASENEFGTVEKMTIEELRTAVKPTMDAIKEKMIDADRELLSIIEKSMNDVLREMKRTTDLERLGFSNVMEGFYFPIMRIQKAQKLEMMSYHNELQSVSNISANKSREEGASQALRVYSIFSIFERHTRAIVTYATMQNTIDSYKRIANISITGNPNDAQKVATYANKVWGAKNAETKGHFEYFNELIEDIQGLKNGRDSFLNRMVGALRGGMATAGIGLNGKVLLSQWSSYAAALPEVGFKSLAKAAKHIGFTAKSIFTKEGRAALSEYGKIVDQWCPLARVRHEDNYAYLAQGVIEREDGTVKVKGKVTEGLNEFRETTMKPIGWMDRAVICTLFEACKYDTATEAAPYGSEENLKAAGEKLTEVILNTQQNALATEKSRAMRSDQEWIKGLVMFSADSMRSLSRLLDNAGELHSINRQLKTFQMSDAARARLESRKKTVAKKLWKSIWAISSNAIWMAALTLFFRFMRGKTIEKEDVIEDLAMDIFTGFFSGMPLIRDLVDLVTKGWGLTDSALDSLTDFVGQVVSVYTTIRKVINGEKEWGALVGALRKFAFAIAQVTGIPVRNVWNCIYGWIKIISEDAADAVDGFLAG